MSARNLVEIASRSVFQTRACPTQQRSSPFPPVGTPHTPEAGTAARNRHRRCDSRSSLASPGQSFQFKVKHYGLNCIMVSFPMKKKVGTESSNEGRLLVSKTQSRRLTSDPAQHGLHTRLDTPPPTRRSFNFIFHSVWPPWTFTVQWFTCIYIYV